MKRKLKTGYDLAKERGYRVATTVERYPHLQMYGILLYWVNDFDMPKLITTRHSRTRFGAIVQRFKLERAARKYCPELP